MIMELKPTTMPTCSMNINITIDVVEDPMHKDKDSIVVIGKVGAIECQSMVFEVDRDSDKESLQEIVDDLTSDVAFKVGERIRTRLYSKPIVVFDDFGISKPDLSEIRSTDIRNEAVNSIHRRQSKTS